MQPNVPFISLNMLKLRPFQNYFTTLYVLGLNPFISFSDITKKRSKIITFFLRSLNVLVSVFVAFKTGFNFQHSKWFFVFAQIVFAYDVCINFIAVFENLKNLNATYRILQILSFVIDMFVTTLDANFPYTVMKKSIKWKFFVILITVLLRFIGHYGYNQVRLLQNIMWSIFNVLTGVHLMHLIFYIEFIRFILAGLCEKIAMLTSRTRCHKKTKEWLHFMQQVQLIYFNLWRIAHIVNSLFGWFMVSYIIKEATQFIYYAYYIFFYSSKVHKHELYIIRKYIF